MPISMETPWTISNENSVYSSLSVSQGTGREFLSIIEDPSKSSLLYRDLASSVDAEALLLLPNGFELIRAQRQGIIDKLIEAAEKKGAAVKILCPKDGSDSTLIRSIQNESKKVKILTYDNYSFGSIFFIVDANRFFRADLNPRQQGLESAFGLVAYSNSRPGVGSFRTFFEILWNQTVLNADFRKREKMKDEFIAVASHELRTPIQPIIGYAYLAAKGKITQEKAWEGVLKEARRLQQLANDILDVSKLESGNMTYFMGYVRINQLLGTLVDSLKNELPAGVQLDVEFDQSKADLEIWIDRSRITQVIMNLLGNAIKFTQEGRIKIQSKELRSENKIEIRIDDTGKGISDEMLPALFEKFSTKGHGSVQNAQGTGLGLYISKAIVNGHGGEISAFNNTDGGATFLISLPISHTK